MHLMHFKQSISERDQRGTRKERSTNFHKEKRTNIEEINTFLAYHLKCTNMIRCKKNIIAKIIT